MRDSVPNARYSSVCNVLRQWSISLIPTYRLYDIKNEQKVGMLLQKRADTRGVGISNAPINVSPHPPPLPGEVRQSRGFDLIKIQLPHPPGKLQIQIPSSYTGHGAYTGSDRGFDANGTSQYCCIVINGSGIQRNRRVRRRECRPRYGCHRRR